MKIIGLIGLLVGTLAAEPQVHRGEIEGAKFQIVVPARPDGKLLMLAHGYRPKGHPLSADFSVDGEFTKGLLGDGWIVASTSYRRNGWIINDALADLSALREKVTELAGEPKRCVVAGGSMGGLIAVRAVEGAIPDVDGAVAVGAALRDFPKVSLHPELSYEPKSPVLFLTNETELDHPQAYRKREGGKRSALWTVKRPGHCNVSDTERLAAVRAVNRWIDGGKVAREADGTVPPPRHPSTARSTGGFLEGTATEVSESWGNITTSFVSVDLEKLKLKLGDVLEVRSDGGSMTAVLARHYSEAPRGKGVAFVTPDGYLRVQINGGRASTKLQAEAGKSLRIAPGDN